MATYPTAQIDAPSEATSKCEQRARKRQRMHQRQQRVKRAYAVLGDWQLARKRADHLSRCPGRCPYCANPRKMLAGRGRARLTQAERKIDDSFQEQMREHLSPSA